jgi:60 kDa SS-A/Ro ribonucleoprotein
MPKGKEVSPDTINKVVRTGTHFLTFVGYLDELTSWNRKVRRLMWSWYQRPLPQLAYQMVKYQSRGDWSQRDALRVIHRKPRNEEESLLFKWVTDRDTFYEGKGENKTAKPTGIALLDAYMKAHEDGITEKNLIKIINDHGLTHEMLPTQHKKSAKVWDALTQKMPMTAMIRNLGVMSSVGLLTSSNLDLVGKIEDNLGNVELLQKARVHPIAILFALKTYAGGEGFRGNLSWKPVQRVVDALDSAFYLAFKAVEPTGKRYMIAVDVSGSMTWTLSNSNLTCCEAAGAMALVTAATEKHYAIYGFSHIFKELKITPRMRLDTVVKHMRDNNFGSTDCALPMIHAQKMNAKFDVFLVITDNETWHGHVHPFQALKNYRKAVNPDAKLVVMGMTATNFSIADPQDAGMLDVCGMDANVPRILRSFVVGDV